MDFSPILKNLNVAVVVHDTLGNCIETNDTNISKYINIHGFINFLGSYKETYFTKIKKDKFECSFESSLGLVKIIGQRKDNVFQCVITPNSNCEERFKVLYEAAEEGILIHDNGYLVDANEAYFKMSGYTRDELQGRNLLAENVHRIDSDMLQKVAENLKNDVEVEYNNVKGYRKGEHIPRYMSCKVKKITVEGKTLRVMIFRDVTDFLEMNKEVKRSRRHFKAITEFSTDVVVTCDFDHINYVTPSITLLTGYTAEQFKKNPVVHYLHEDDREMFNLILKEAHRSPKKTIPIVFSRIKKKGVLDEEKRWVYIEALVTFIDEDEYNKGNFVINIRDIGSRIDFEKERTRLETELNHAKKMETIGTLAGGIAHDFKNILMPIIGYANMITYDLDGTKYDFIIEDLNKIITAGERANELVNQILTFSHKKEIEKDTIIFDKLLTNTLSLLRASIPTSLEFSINNEFKEGAIKGNYTQIQQVIMNICTNAAHSMDNKGKVSIFVHDLKIRGTLVQRFGKLDTGDYIALSIEDKGYGISSENIERIFDPFFTTKEIGKGTGLGLSIAQGIINNHNGIINVTSKVNNGTIFEIFLPIHKEVTSVLQAEQTTLSKPKQEQGNILFLDDEEMTRDLVTKILTRSGYHVKAMKDGQEGIAELLKNTDYDILITDQSMPKMTGLEIARKAKSIIRDIPVILISGSVELLKIDTKKLGIDEFAMKPVIPNDLLKLVKKHL